MLTMDTNANVPAFITKLWRIVEDVTYNHLIQWSQNGRSFIIHDQSKFAKELLPLYFKHSNMASFIRQLNMYGFRKVSNIENSGLRTERDDIEFFHHFFSKDKERELEFIKRKTPISKSGDSSAKPDDVNEMLQDMESIKGKQGNMDVLLTNMQRENEALWREIAILRQKHHKQQQVVEKLIQFLVSLVQNRGLLNIKRKPQLMIDDTDENRQLLRNKLIKRSDLNDFTSTFGSTDSPSNGPIIHDITDDYIDDSIHINASNVNKSVNLNEIPQTQQLVLPVVTTKLQNDTLGHSSKSDPSLDILDPLQESIKELGLVAECPVSQLSIMGDNTDVDSLLKSSLNTPPATPLVNKNDGNEGQTQPNEVQPNEVKDLVLSKQNNDQMITPISQGVINDHIDGIDAELDWLQDQLSSGINIDPSTLMGVRPDPGIGLNDNYWLKQLFNMEDDNNSSIYSMVTNYPNNAIIGNEVIQFNPNANSIFDDLELTTGNEVSQDTLLDDSLLPELDLNNIVTESQVQNDKLKDDQILS
ncbi:heat shock factor protein-like isoform X2 [Oppia nitens]|uniref:heat shock factor protein-like isoform X2 n=1 Tax=Oppia nitens TaxID=1686743 RepID=UPI0023DA6A58|nr:heat shock factor protein-like isoform X2 [Oppia nitens]